MPPSTFAVPAFPTLKLRHLLSYEKDPVPGRLVYKAYPLTASGTRVPPEQLDAYRKDHVFVYPQCFHCLEARFTLETGTSCSVPWLVCGNTTRHDRCDYKVNLLEVVANPTLFCEAYDERQDAGGSDSYSPPSTCPSSSSVSGDSLDKAATRFLVRVDTLLLSRKMLMGFFGGTANNSGRAPLKIIEKTKRTHRENINPSATTFSAARNPRGRGRGPTTTTLARWNR
ncbi:hypothetical protein BKA70DRAFT_1214456 [Coprinopsis sp. MPI-PUGE-AT-0042]|nr:hypothetical protein BKA70DRAFT_1214456 [Coprinopsis sp. MPI-PUGE-AT-0042]